MLKKLSKNKFFKIIFVNLIYLSLSLIKKTSNWSGVNEEVIEKQLQNNKAISCKDVTFAIFGVSLATINTFLSALLATITLIVFIKYEKK